MADSPTPPPADRPSLVFPASVLAAVVLLFGLRETGAEAIDLAVQSLFWNGSGWLVPKDAGWPHQVAYTGPKVLLYLLALWLIWAMAFPAAAPAWMGRRRAAYILAGMALTTVLCTQLRDVTGMATPRGLLMYGGRWEHFLLFDAKPPGHPSNAFPAGHASGGFGLLCLAFAWPEPRARRLGLLTALLVGGWMGLYQMARGEHFLSHTLATAALAWLVAAALARAMCPAGSPS